MTFNCTDNQALGSRRQASAPPPMTVPVSAVAIEAGEVLEELRNAFARDWGVASASAARLAALLSHLDSGPGAPRMDRTGLARWQLRKVEAYIETNLERQLLVEDMATAAGLSSGHFCRAFKDSFGVTPHVYVMRLRIKRAQALMLSTHDPLSQIALACGLADQAHLTRLFRRMTGTTPSAWRRTFVRQRVVPGALAAGASV